MPPGDRRDAGAMRCGAGHRRSRALPRSSGGWVSRRSTWETVDRPDRVAVRLGVLGGPARRAAGRPRWTRFGDARDAGVAGVRRDCRRLLRAREGGARPGLFERQYQVRPRRARGRRAAQVLRARGEARRDRRRAADGVHLKRSASSVFGDAFDSSMIDALAAKVRGGGRLDRAEALELYLARAHAPPRATRRRGPRPEASRRDRHLHHRSQRQLHERVHRALQLLRVLSAGRVVRRLRARLRGDLPQDRRDDRARRRSVAAAGRSQPGSAARVVRGSVPRRQGTLSGVSAARALAAGSHPPLAPVAAAGASGHRAARVRPGSTASPAVAPRFSSIASASCSTATTRRRPTSGSA